MDSLGNLAPVPEQFGSSRPTQEQILESLEKTKNILDCNTMYELQEMAHFHCRKFRVTIRGAVGAHLHNRNSPQMAVFGNFYGAEQSCSRAGTRTQRTHEWSLKLT